MKEALTFDDVTIVPAASSLMPADADVSTKITNSISLNIPLISSAMDTVTEGNMAIAMAQLGGLGVIHRNLSLTTQISEVYKVKRFESGIVVDPITLTPDVYLESALELMSEMKISGVPITEDDGKLVGILTNRDVRFATNMTQPIGELMTKDNLVTVKEDIDTEAAKQILHQHRIEKLLVVNDAGDCTGLITVKDIEKSKLYPNACKDEQGRLRVAAAVGTGSDHFERACQLIDAEVDIIVVDTAHGHSSKVIEMVQKIKKEYPNSQIIAGNVATAAAAEVLIAAGADAIKVGIGPGSICTTRIVSGVGIPQFTAIQDVAAKCFELDTPIIADGGIKYSGDLAKAIGAGANCVMIGSLFAGTDESPGDVFSYQGRLYKTYRGMGSIGAMMKGSADRYFQDTNDVQKLVPEGIEGRVPHKGPVENIIYQLIGGLKSSMGYTGNETITDMNYKCEFNRVTSAGLRESHVHDVSVTRESPNYPDRK